ncbi:MAG: VRR-NUC domain-containing protein [Litorimonas sp.]
MGERFLSHQLQSSTWDKTGDEYLVTGGFQPNICSECRGLPADNFPKAETYGNSSKVKRYYWRELHFARYEKILELIGEDADQFSLTKKEQETVERAALEEIKALHKTSPKYVFSDKSQADVLRDNNVDILRVAAPHIRVEGQRRIKIAEGETLLSPEEFAAHHYQLAGFQTLELESVPFHVLFGTFTWLLIQDYKDEKVRMVSFGRRDAFDTHKTQEQIFTHLPSDFGQPSYGIRRKVEIDEFFERDLFPERESLLWLFDYWLSHSEHFRQYLWAHREDDIETARRLIEILPPLTIVRILRYLVDDYWKRYTGWPDLLLFKDDEFRFVEVKSSNDKLSGDQKSWIEDNHTILELPFQIFKITKPNLQS